MPAKVYFLPWKEKDKLEGLLRAAGLPALLKDNDYVAIKTHFGEKGNEGYVKPRFFNPLIEVVREKKTRPFLTDTNTIYHGERNNAVGHLAQAARHGFNISEVGVPIVIADGLHGKCYENIKIQGRHFKEVKIAAAIAEADMIIAVSHFKGHLLAGFGAAIKNLGMGGGARIGKFEMHSNVAPSIALAKCIGCGACVEVCSQGALKVVDEKITIDIKKCAGCGECILACGVHALSVTWNEPGKNVQEKFAEYAAGVVQNKKIFCITFINNVTPNCDCLSKSEPSMVKDIGILASTDPVAIDQAGLDLILKTAGKDVFRREHPAIDHDVQLAHAQKMGLGTRKYQLIDKW